MRAVVYDPQAPANLRLADVDEPVVAESEALIQVRATALNFGEVHFIDQMRKPGEVPGWDAAGVVVQAAADGTGPAAGERRKPLVIIQTARLISQTATGTAGSEPARLSCE